MPEGWATAEDISSLDVKRDLASIASAGSRALALDPSSGNALVGGNDGTAVIYSLAQNDVVQTISTGGSAVTDGLLLEREGQLTPILATTSGEIQVFSSGEKVAGFTSHASSANAIALHPGGDILVSVGSDKSFVLYDLASQKALTQMYTDSGKSSHALWSLLER